MKEYSSLILIMVVIATGLLVNGSTEAETNQLFRFIEEQQELTLDLLKRVQELEKDPCDPMLLQDLLEVTLEHQSRLDNLDGGYQLDPHENVVDTLISNGPLKHI